MIADICNWSPSAKLVNLITRLQGQAYAFFTLALLSSVPVIPSWLLNYKRGLHLLGYLYVDHSSLFHDKKQSILESVDQYAQDLHALFYNAYPNVQQGTKEAETLEQTVLVNQFVAGLLYKIKSILVGMEGNFSQLLAKPRFEEAKLRTSFRFYSINNFGK